MTNKGKENISVPVGIWKVKVSLGKGESRTTRVDSEAMSLEVDLCAQPIEGEANRELVRFFRKAFGMRASILFGFSSRQKRVELTK